ncbi:MAG: sigma-70 family RNA polymerase sigma factor [Gammaproteobacteria bacterium]|nr:sigma-70 family RNA polymerase sigma factor [Gammaproteobacteria bacterium]
MEETLASPAPDFAALWAGYRRGERAAQERLLAACYQELRRIARSLLARDSAAQYLQPTELAHEAALRLLRFDRIELRDQHHFLALAARIMRQVLVDEVRRQRAQKRQPHGLLTTWFEPGLDATVLDIEALDRSLARLAGISPERARVVELRFFAGLGLPEIAAVMQVSERTLKRHWQAARAWLMNDMLGSDGAGPRD